MAGAFDSSAWTYDSDFDDLPATKRIRSIVHDIALSVFPAGGSILELNCGTGTDAIVFAEKGLHVLATDASPAMITVARGKSVHQPVQNNPEFQVLSFDELSNLNGRIFDGAFSNMGGLNCIADLSAVSGTVARLLRPGAYFVATFLSDLCLWETLSFLLRLDLRNAFRRQLRNGEPVSIPGGTVNVFYHSPPAIRRSFHPCFRFLSLTGLNIVTPPPSSTGAYRLLDRQIDFLNSLEDDLANKPVFNRLGDHFVVVLQRSNVAPPS